MEAYDFDRITDRRNTFSYKWDIKEGELPMWVADMDFETAPCVKEALIRRAEHGIFGYSVVPQEWNRAICGWWQRRHHFQMQEDWLIFCTGVIPAIDVAVKRMTNVGDNVVVQTPVYNIFYNCVENHGRHVLENRLLYEKGQYEQAKPVFKKFVKSQPNNGNYNLWYGVCCLNTGEAEEAIKYLETAVKRRVTSGQLYLAQAYNAVYRFEDAVGTYEDYIAELTKRRRSTAEAEKLLEKSKANLRLLKGVEEVCFIDSFVVDKKDFLEAYKISPESGKLFMYDTYFENSNSEGGTVYERS